MRKKYIALYVSAFIFFMVLLVNLQYLSLDEIWCFGFSRRIAEGLIPYRDFNLVPTPLFFFIGTLFSHSLMIYRIYGALVDAAVVALTFYICNKKQVNQQLTVMLTVCNLALVASIPIPNYNILLLVGLMLSCLAVDRFLAEKNARWSFLFGLSLALNLLVKQNVPAILILICSLIFLVLIIKKTISFKTFTYYLGGLLVPMAIFSVYAWVTRSLSAFIGYAFLGLNSFTANYASAEGFQIQYVPIFLTLLITISLARRVWVSESGRLMSFTTFIFSLCSYMLILPIIDMAHSVMLLIFNIYLSVYVLKDLKLKLTLKKLEMGLCLVIILIILFRSLNRTNSDLVRSDIEPYQGILISPGVEENIAAISAFIMDQESKGFDVVIIDKSAYLYNLPVGDCNGVLDLATVGNIGSLSSEDIISLIDEKDIILADKTYENQDIVEIREYVFANYVQEGTVGSMGIYRQK